MLAGMLVVVAAGGVLTTYFIMSDYITYVLHGDGFDTVEVYRGLMDSPAISMDW